LGPCWCCGLFGVYSFDRPPIPHSRDQGFEEKEHGCDGCLEQRGQKAENENERRREGGKCKDITLYFSRSDRSYCSIARRHGGSESISRLEVLNSEF
jgi:hypothetical protein